MYLDQHALNSPFNAFSTAAEVLTGVDLSGKFAIVTGGYSGLGLEASRALVEAGATVIVPARNPAKARAAVGELKGAEIVPMDLTNSPSIVAFANRFLESGRPLSFLINSAGIMATALFRDADGHEGQFATNHLGHFRLVRALWPSLVAQEERG